MVGAIPYRTIPEVQLGPIALKTFGLMVAIGILVGVAVAARHARSRGHSGDEVARLAILMVVIGLVGARLAWVLSHLDRIEFPLDVVAVWRGGLAFTGGFLAAVAVAALVLRRWPAGRRWGTADGMALGLTVGLAIGRLGCIAVGEHLGGPTSFPLGMRYEGGATVEGPLQVGVAYHNTALYEVLHLTILAGVLWWLLRPGRSRPGTGLVVFALWYGAARFLTDFLRIYDREVLGLTGAQWACLAVVVVASWLAFRLRLRPA
ncbi:MAG TPA: prolipoprotein diacylglyceryl transferase family protein [Actinomycetota bacterium]|nr:prolipoprotein diacylglyceryl transferase family protein [Actinomycetota bacterium]